ncbi:IS256 family transposase [Limosilactobacillus fermentum]|uniref:IS256 family transposase n=1 Tax=Limosilactobacillus fermentum TaxID=1613 RepID=UPI002A69A53E|nr:IS256 family transposase [Limosilactobacillus fermentum]WPP07504.1 IS256 family transposase [Limosilactobacillus fermentum]WRS44386.1 IS256 family transposase [Limosilactobacillus fermentum]
MPKVELNLEDDELKELLLGDRDKAMQSIMAKILDEILKSEATEQIKAKAYERSDERTNSRNGYRVRQLTTRVGSLELHVPKLRHGNFSTRKVAEITKKLCGTTFSKSTVSALCSNLDDQVLDFNRRPLTQKYAFVYADAILFKVHRGHVVTSNSLLVAIGIDPSGRREVLGFDIGDSESKAAWMDFFSELKQRGLTNVDMFVSDAHCGLRDAINTQFQGSLWQRCQFHFSNDCTSILALKDRKEVANRLKDLFNAPTYDQAVERRDQLVKDWQTEFPKVVKKLENSFDELMVIYQLPEELRKRLRTNNTIERVNQEIRRRDRVIRIFPNDLSVLRLMGALLIEQNEKWAAGPRYLNMTVYHGIEKDDNSEEAGMLKLVK